MHIAFSLMIAVPGDGARREPVRARVVVGVPAARLLRDRRHRQPLLARRRGRRSGRLRRGRHRRASSPGCGPDHWAWRERPAGRRPSGPPSACSPVADVAASAGDSRSAQAWRVVRAQPADRVAADAERDLDDGPGRQPRRRRADHRGACSSSAGVAFIIGSVMDTLDGRYSRMSGKGTLFGAFLDSTLDRIEEGIVLTAVAWYFADRRRRGRRGRVRVRRARLADGLLHARPRRGAGRRVQGRASPRGRSGS